MLLALKGFASLIFFLFLTGYTFLSFGKTKTIEKTFLFSIIISLWLSWIFIVFINFFKLNFGGLELTLSIIFSLILILIYDKNKYFKKDVTTFFLYLFLCAIIITVIFSKKYIPVFVHGDAVFQWNGRWAWSLYQNNFIPDGNYPVFLPGLWALIYKSIETFDNWIFANFSLIIILVLAFLTLLEFKKINFKFFILNFFIYIYICSTLYNRFFIGYMDGPLTLLIYSSVNLILLFILSKDYDYLFYGAFLISLTTIVKQQGFILPSLFFVLGIFFVNSNLISLKRYFFLSLITVTHFVILTFFYDSNPFSFTLGAITGEGGNQQYLKDLSKIHMRDTNIFIYSLLELSKRFNMILILVLFGISLLNILLFKKNLINQIGTIFLLFSLISFFYFAKYGSYDERNGWFVIPFLFGSFLCVINNFNLKFINNLKKNIKFPYFIENLQGYFDGKLIIVYMLIFFLFIGTIIEKVVGFNYVQKLVQEQLGNKELAIQVKELIENSDECTKVYSNFHIVVYNYHIFKYYNLDKSKSKIIEFGGWNFEDKVNKINCKTGQIWITYNNNYPESFKQLLEKVNHKIYSNHLIVVK